jgi:hypothetical protein
VFDPLLGVVPSFEQLRAQQSRAALTPGIAPCAKAAFLQQSISPIKPPMLHGCSLKCNGLPATAPAPTASKMTRDMSRVLMANCPL